MTSVCMRSFRAAGKHVQRGPKQLVSCANDIKYTKLDNI